MNWTKLAEDRIAEAIANGEFDNLPGQGKPLDLEEYFAMPSAERAGTALLKNANVIPPEVQLLKEIAELENAIAFHAGGTGVAKLLQQLEEKRVAFSLAMERRRRRELRTVE